MNVDPFDVYSLGQLHEIESRFNHAECPSDYHQYWEEVIEAIQQGALHIMHIADLMKFLLQHNFLAYCRMPDLGRFLDAVEQKWPKEQKANEIFKELLVVLLDQMKKMLDEKTYPTQDDLYDLDHTIDFLVQYIKAKFKLSRDELLTL